MVSYDIFTSPNIYEAIDVAKENNIDFSFVEKSVLEIDVVSCCTCSKKLCFQSFICS
jgi:hypothetical protein